MILSAKGRFGAALVLVALVFSGCAGAPAARNQDAAPGAGAVSGTDAAPVAAPPSPGGAAPAAQTRADTSYAVGMWLGMNIMQEGLAWNYDYSELLAGIRDALEGRDLRLGTEQASRLIRGAHAENQARQAEENRLAGEAFLERNRSRAGVTVTESGLQYEALVTGSGPRPGESDTVRVHYELSLIDGTVLGSTFEEGEPIEVPLDQVIDGWNEGLRLMPAGSTFMLFIPPSIGYGGNATGGVPPNSTLVFKVELVSIVR